MAQELVSMREYARRSGLNVSTVSREVKSGLIPVHGSRRLIDPEEADQRRGRHLHPGLRKGSFANRSPTWPDRERDLAEELKIAGICEEDDTMPVDEHLRIVDITIKRLKQDVLESFGEMEKALGFEDDD